MRRSWTVPGAPWLRVSTEAEWPFSPAATLRKSEPPAASANRSAPKRSSETSRRSIGCAYVTVRFYCAYAVRTTDGNAGTAFAKIYSNPGKPLQVEQPSFHEANEIECKLGFDCKPAAGAEPGGPAGASARKDTTPPPPHEAAACKGLRVEVVGAGETCLDPADPARRDFRDCNNGFCGPAMVALPKGRGMRGSSAADMARLSKDDPQADSFRSETPQREVTIGYQLAVGKFEVTFDEWDFCLADGGCKRRPEDPGDRTRGTRPVMHVSWIEVHEEFLPWLNRKLGLSGASAYRLLTEAEWEYAARAGTSTKYAFGDIITTAQVNFYARACPQGRFFRAERLWSPRHARQRAGMGPGLLRERLRRRARGRLGA